LWLTSTVEGAKNDRFRVVASSAGRTFLSAGAGDFPSPDRIFLSFADQTLT
jgi:hypothetical protein